MDFLNTLKNETNYGYTENGAVKHNSTLNAVYDMFALCGAYRTRSEADCILMFKKALAEDETLALKCLFYIGDCRGGQGERRFFRVCFHWLCNEYPEVARRNLEFIPTYRRWDDVLYSCDGTPVMEDALDFIKRQLVLDMECKTPSLLAKWLPSENASAAETKRMGNIVREHLGMTHKQYRKTLTYLRQLINIVETLMSHNMWDKIEFDKIPSKAGLIYKNAFARRDIIAKKYEEFAKDKTTTVNAGTLYPYEIVEKAIRAHRTSLDDPTRLMVNKYWENQKDYLNGEPCKMLCVCDTSGSMTWGSGAAVPINVAIGLSLYCAERVGEPFKDHYISFSSRPQLIETKGVDFVDKVERIYKTNLCENTDLVKTFDLLRDISLKVAPKDRLDTVVVISDMEIDDATWRTGEFYDGESTATEMEKVRKQWESYGLKMPRLIYWNVNARNDTILDFSPNVSFVSGCSPVIFEQILSGKTGMDLMLDKLLSDRYKDIH